jgi:hypothetical protein
MYPMALGNSLVNITIRTVQCVETKNRMNVNESLTFRNAQGDGFKLAATVVRRMLTYAQHELARKEAGGILLGRYILDSNDVVVDEVTVPTPEDVRTRVNFVRAKRGH